MKYIYFEQLNKLIPCCGVTISIDETKYNLFKKPKIKLKFEVNGLAYSFVTKNKKAAISAFKDFKKLWYENNDNTVIVIKSNVSEIKLAKDIVDKRYIGEIGQLHKIFKSKEI